MVQLTQGLNGRFTRASSARQRGECETICRMRRIDALSRAQRVVVVVALGLALWFVGSYLVSLGSIVGWYSYSPITGAPYGRGLHGWLRLIIWLVLTGVWALASVRVLRPASENAASE